MSQQRVNFVMQKEGNGSFIRLNEWAARFKGISARPKTSQSHDTKDMCLPLVLELFANTEVCPSSDHTDGIDLQKLYAMLANLMTSPFFIDCKAY